MPSNRQFLLAQRPVGLPTRDTFRRVETPLGEPADGQVLVRNRYLSIDPAMRGWMNEGKSYIEPVPLGGVMRALGVAAFTTKMSGLPARSHRSTVAPTARRS